MTAQAGLYLAWSETPEDTFCCVMAHIFFFSQNYSASIYLKNIKKSEELVYNQIKVPHKILCLITRKPVFRVATRVDSNQTVQPQKLGRGLKFWI